MKSILFLAVALLLVMSCGEEASLPRDEAADKFRAAYCANGERSPLIKRLLLLADTDDCHEAVLRLRTLKNWNLSALEPSESELSLAPLNYFANIERIDLSGNGLRDISDVCNCPSKLKELDLGYNRMSTIPNNCPFLANASSLTLDFNFLTEMPDAATVQKVVNLELRGNGIETLTAQAYSASSVDLRLNKFTDTDETHRRLSELKKNVNLVFINLDIDTTINSESRYGSVGGSSKTVSGPLTLVRSRGRFVDANGKERLKRGDTVYFDARGGVPPYKYRISQGTGGLDLDQKAYLVSANDKKVQLEVIDSKGNTATAEFPVATTFPGEVEATFGNQKFNWTSLRHGDVDAVEINDRLFLVSKLHSPESQLDYLSFDTRHDFVPKPVSVGTIITDRLIKNKLLGISKVSNLSVMGERVYLAGTVRLSDAGRHLTRPFLIGFDAGGMPDPTFGVRGLVIQECDSDSCDYLGHGATPNGEIYLFSQERNESIHCTRYDLGGRSEEVAQPVQFQEKESLNFIGFKAIKNEAFAVFTRNQTHVLFAKLKRNGSVDPSFGNDGFLETAIPDTLHSCEIDPSPEAIGLVCLRGSAGFERVFLSSNRSEIVRSGTVFPWSEQEVIGFQAAADGSSVVRMQYGFRLFGPDHKLEREIRYPDGIYPWGFLAIPGKDFMYVFGTTGPGSTISIAKMLVRASS